MRSLALALLMIGTVAWPSQAAAADFSGHWRYFQRDAVQIPPLTYDHSADFILWQRGDRVYGTWSESGQRGSQGCIKGVAKARSLQVQMCLEGGSFGSERAGVCPAFAASRDRFDLARKSLVWYRYNEPASKWEKYLTLTKRNAVSSVTWPKECGTVSPSS